MGNIISPLEVGDRIRTTTAETGTIILEIKRIVLLLDMGDSPLVEMLRTQGGQTDTVSIGVRNLRTWMQQADWTRVEKAKTCEPSEDRTD